MVRDTCYYVDVDVGPTASGRALPSFRRVVIDMWIGSRLSPTSLEVSLYLRISGRLPKSSSVDFGRFRLLPLRFFSPVVVFMVYFQLQPRPLSAVLCGVSIQGPTLLSSHSTIRPVTLRRRRGHHLTTLAEFDGNIKSARIQPLLVTVVLPALVLP